MYTCKNIQGWILREALTAEYAVADARIDGEG